MVGELGLSRRMSFIACKGLIYELEKNRVKAFIVIVALCTF